jgi:hypothetical protein
MQADEHLFSQSQVRPSPMLYGGCACLWVPFVQMYEHCCSYFSMRSVSVYNYRSHCFSCAPFLFTSITVIVYLSDPSECTSIISLVSVCGPEWVVPWLPETWDRKMCSQLPRDPKPRMTVLARTRNRIVCGIVIVSVSFACANTVVWFFCVYRPMYEYCSCSSLSRPCTFILVSIWCTTIFVHFLLSDPFSYKSNFLFAWSSTSPSLLGVTFCKVLPHSCEVKSLGRIFKCYASSTGFTACPGKIKNVLVLKRGWISNFSAGANGCNLIVRHLWIVYECRHIAVGLTNSELTAMECSVTF